MDVIRIEGGEPLRGNAHVSGAKNAALPIFAACLLTDEKCVVENVPDLTDVRFMAEILTHLGVKVERIESNTWSIQAGDTKTTAPYELVRKMRASVCLMGPLLGKMRKAEVSFPGGCVIGSRPIDLHLKGFAKLGCDVTVENGYVRLNGSGLQGADVFLGGRHGSTALGTANLVMAAVLAPGITNIESAACEPEVVDLCNMLLRMGARIDGIGSHHLRIEGVRQLKGCAYRIIPDRIEAGTFIIAAAITGGRISISGVEIEHLRALIDKLDEAAIEVSIEGRDRLIVEGSGEHRAVDVITLPYPGFPTDLQAQMCALMSVTKGLSIITERIYPHRFMHIPELQRMGADIAVEGASAIVNGRVQLSGAPVMASDLRASAALVLAGLGASNETWVQRVYHIDRGFERIDQKFQSLGARIERIKAEDMPASFRAQE